MSVVAGKSDGVETLFPRVLAPLAAGGWASTTDGPRGWPRDPAGRVGGPAPSAGGAPRPDRTPEPGGGPVLWHQVQPSEDWAGLVARYNIAEPQALLAANGLTEPRDLLPGDWVCVPCRLARPVWELPLPEEGEAPHDLAASSASRWPLPPATPPPAPEGLPTGPGERSGSGYGPTGRAPSSLGPRGCAWPTTKAASTKPGWWPTSGCPVASIRWTGRGSPGPTLRPISRAASSPWMASRPASWGHRPPSGPTPCGWRCGPGRGAPTDGTSAGGPVVFERLQQLDLLAARRLGRRPPTSGGGGGGLAGPRCRGHPRGAGAPLGPGLRDPDGPLHPARDGPARGAPGAGAQTAGPHGGADRPLRIRTGTASWGIPTWWGAPGSS